MLKKGVKTLYLLVNHFLGNDCAENLSARLKKIKSKIDLILLNDIRTTDDNIFDGFPIGSLLNIPEISIIFSTLWLFIESDLSNIIVDNRSTYINFFSTIYHATIEGNSNLASDNFLEKEWQYDKERFQNLDYQSFCSFIYEKLDLWILLLPENDTILYIIFLFEAIFDYDYYEMHNKIALKELKDIHSILECGENMETFLLHFNLEDYNVYPGTLRIKDSLKTSLFHVLEKLNKIHRNDSSIYARSNKEDHQHQFGQLGFQNPANETIIGPSSTTTTGIVAEENYHQYRPNQKIILLQRSSEESLPNIDNNNDHPYTPYTDEEDSGSRPSSPLTEDMRERGEENNHIQDGLIKHKASTRTRRHAEEVLVDLGIIQSYEDEASDNILPETPIDTLNTKGNFPVIITEKKISTTNGAANASKFNHQSLTDSSIIANKSRSAATLPNSTLSISPSSDVKTRNISPSKLIDTGENTINIRMTDPDSLEASLRIISRQSSPKNDSQIYANLNKKLYNRLQQQQQIVKDTSRQKSNPSDKSSNQHTNTVLPSVSYCSTSRATSPLSNQPKDTKQSSSTKEVTFSADDFYPSSEFIHRELLDSKAVDGIPISISHYDSKELLPYLQVSNRSDPLARLEQQKPTVKLVLREMKGFTPISVSMSMSNVKNTTDATSQIALPPDSSILNWTAKVLSYINLNYDDLSAYSRDSVVESGVESDAALSRQRSDVTSTSDLSPTNTGDENKLLVDMMTVDSENSFFGVTAEELTRFESRNSRTSDVGEFLGDDVDRDSLYTNEPTTNSTTSQSQALEISVTRHDSAASDVAASPSALRNSSRVGKLPLFPQATSGEDSGTPGSYLPMEEVTSPEISPRIPAYLDDSIPVTANDTLEVKRDDKSISVSSPPLQVIPKKVTINDEGIFSENLSIDANSHTQSQSLQCDLPDGYSWVLKADMISVLSQSLGNEGLAQDQGLAQRVDFLPSVMPSWNPVRARASRAPHRLFPIAFYNSHHMDNNDIRRGVNFGHKTLSSSHQFKSNSFFTSPERKSTSPLPSSNTYTRPISSENIISKQLAPIESTAFLTEVVNKPNSEEHHPYTPHNNIRKVSSQGNFRNGQPHPIMKTESAIQPLLQKNVSNDNNKAAAVAAVESLLALSTVETTTTTTTTTTKTTSTTTPGDNSTPIPDATPQTIPFKLSLNRVSPRKSISSASESLTRLSSPVVSQVETFTKDNIFDLHGKSTPKPVKDKNKKSNKLKPIKKDGTLNTPEIFINSISRPLGSKSLSSLHNQRSEYLPLSSSATPWPAPSGLHCMETDKLDSRFAWEDRKELLLHAHNDTGKITLALKHQKLVKQSFERYVKNAPSRINTLENRRANNPLVLYGMNGE